MQRPGEPVFLKCCKNTHFYIKETHRSHECGRIDRFRLKSHRAVPFLASRIGPETTKTQETREKSRLLFQRVKSNSSSRWFLTIFRGFNKQKCSEEQRQHGVRGQDRQTDASSLVTLSKITCELRPCSWRYMHHVSEGNYYTFSSNILILFIIFTPQL